MTDTVHCKSTSNEPADHKSEENADRANPPLTSPAREKVARFALGLGALLTGALAAGCNMNQSGDLKASHLGDMTNALTSTARTSGEQVMAAACGTPAAGRYVSDPNAAASAPSPFQRRPFLQQMTDTSVNVDWISAAQPAASVVVMTPDGAPVTTVPAVVADGAASTEANQSWTAPVKGLTADTTYCYEVRAGDAVWKRGGFHTAPAAGAGRPIRFVAFGDSGTGSDDQAAAYEQMHTVPFDFLIHTGDVGYGSGTTTELQRFFFDFYADTLESFPAFPSSGNHEYNSADASPFRAAFDLPKNGGPAGAERWYSFDWGDAHFVAVDTERMGDVQAKWLDADLAATNKPWKIVFGHKPPFSSGDHGNDSTFRKYFNPILERHKVQLVLNGHDHNYERTTAQNGVTYVVTGGGGAGTRPMGNSAFTAFGDSVIHFVYVTIDGDTLTLHAIDGTGEEFDSAAIKKT